MLIFVSDILLSIWIKPVEYLHKVFKKIYAILYYRSFLSIKKYRS